MFRSEGYDTQMEWTNEKVYALIDMYKEHNFLWDYSLKEYKNRFKRMEALSQISATIGVRVDEIERKIKNLMCHFSRELKKERESENADGEQVYKSKWFCLNRLMFLKGRSRFRSGTGIQVPEETESNEFDPENFDYNIKYEQCETSIQEESDPLNVHENFERPRKRARTSHPTEEGEEGETQRQGGSTSCTPIITIGPSLQSISKDKDKEERDPCTTYGEHVANEMRNLTSRAQTIVKHIVNTALFEAAMGKYDAQNLNLSTTTPFHCCQTNNCMHINKPN